MKFHLWMLVIGALAVAALSAAAPAQAAGTVDLRGFVGGGVGYYRLDGDDFLDEDNDFKDDKFAWKLFGGLEVNRVFAVEGGFVEFGNTSDGDLELDANGWTIAGIVSVPVLPVVTPYAKAGQLFWDRKRSLGPISVSDDGNDFFFGLGARFSLVPNLDLRLEYERMELDDTDLDMGSVSVQFRF